MIGKLRSSKENFLLFLIGFFVAVILIFFVLNKDSGPRIASLGEIKRKVEEINSRLKYTRVVESTTRLEGEFPRIGLAIKFVENSESGTYFFESKKYTIETGGDESQLPTAQLCRIIEYLQDGQENVPLLEALRSVELKGNLSGKLAGLEVTTDLGWLVELIYSLKELLDLSSRRAEILVKGYADGQAANWSRPLEASPYDYRQVAIHHPLCVGSSNPVVYRLFSSTLPIPDPYGNRDLANLRGQFVKSDLVEQFLANCPVITTHSVFILEGMEFRKPNQEMEQKAQVYVNIF